jgi:hypothetical protein
MLRNHASGVQTTYEQEFLAAIERTKGFGLVPPAFTVSSKQRWFDADNLTRFPFVVRDALGEPDFEDVVGQCMAIHYRLLSFSTSLG